MCYYSTPLRWEKIVTLKESQWSDRWPKSGYQGARVDPAHFNDGSPEHASSTLTYVLCEVCLSGADGIQPYIIILSYPMNQDLKRNLKPAIFIKSTNNQ